MLAPRRTPKPIVDKLSDEIRATLREPESVKRLTAMGLDVIASPPEEFRHTIQEDVKRWAKVVKEANIKVQ